VQAGRHLAGDLPGATLVARLREREQEGHDEDVDLVLLDQLGDRQPHRLLVELLHELAGGADPLRHLARALARDQGLGLAVEEVVDVVARLAPDLQDVAEPERGDQPEACTLALEEGVRRDGRTVDDLGDLA
jgi:hypothetical protein